MSESKMIIAIPIQSGRVSAHFGHPEAFAFLTVDREKAEIVERHDLTPPPHQPGVLPRWLREQGAHVVLAGGIGPRAVQMLEGFGMNVITGVPELPPDEAVDLWLGNRLAARPNACDHGTPSHTPRCGGH